MEGLIQVRMPETKLIDKELSFLLSTRLFILSRPINQNGTVISMAHFFFRSHCIPLQDDRAQCWQDLQQTGGLQHTYVRTSCTRGTPGECRDPLGARGSGEKN